MKNISFSPSGLPSESGGLRRTLIALLVFGAAFGYVEAAAAIYLRVMYEPIHQRVFPTSAAGDLFPLIPLDRLESEEPRGMHWLGIELGREAATLVMLAALGLALGRTFQQRFAVFLIGFGLWDIFYYVFLKVHIDWPDSLLTWDLLFLLPVPWAGPVLAPLLVSLGMIGTGLVMLGRAARGWPLELGWPHWTGLVGGGLMVVIAFCWDYSHLMAGGQPQAFNWLWFASGGLVGLLTFGHAWRRSTRDLLDRRTEGQPVLVE
jgi:hypothetical protein